MAQAEAAQQFIGGQFTIGSVGFEQGFYLVAYLIAYLVARRSCNQSFPDDREHEFDKGRGLSKAIRSSERFIIFSLVIADQAFKIAVTCSIPRLLFSMARDA